MLVHDGQIGPVESSLRGLGYQNILFLQGHGVANADGLPILAAYN